jgi:hypothetical protein
MIRKNCAILVSVAVTKKAWNKRRQNNNSDEKMEISGYIASAFVLEVIIRCQSRGVAKLGMSAK